FKRARRAALAGTSKNALYVEFGADDGASPNDWGLIGKANPSYVYGRTSKTAILRTRENLAEESFSRDAMGVWDLYDVAVQTFEFDRWHASYLTDSKKPPTQGVRCYAVRFSVDGAYVALPAAIKPKDGPIFVEGVTRASTSDGTQWLVDWLVERSKRAAHIVIDGKYGAGY